MLNAISIDSLDNCKCSLISNTNDGSNKVILQIHADTSKNPLLEINSESIPITANDFEYEIDSNLYIGSDLLKFRITDDDHIGEYFQIQKVTSLNGNLFLKQKSNFEYILVEFNSDSGKDQIAWQENTAERRIYTLGDKIKVVSGSKVLSVKGDYQAIFTYDELSTLFGPGWDYRRLTIITNNGDDKTALVHFYEPEYWPPGPAYYQYWYPTFTGNLRINYKLIYEYE